MSEESTEEWLARLQARFSAALRTPLVVWQNALRSDLSGNVSACEDIQPSARRNAAQRLSSYHRQYWMRLLRTLQEQYPLTTQLLGAWFFNQYALRFLSDHAPVERDLGQLGQGFDRYLDEALHSELVSHDPRGPTLPRAALLQAARLDATTRRVFLAPKQPLLRIADAAELASSKLRFSSAFARFEERWPLVQLRAQVLARAQEEAIPLPSELREPRSWAIHRTEDGVAQVELGPREARLLVLLEQHAVGHALALLERECPADERGVLQPLVENFFATAHRLGFFRR